MSAKFYMIKLFASFAFVLSLGAQLQASAQKQRSENVDRKSSSKAWTLGTKKFTTIFTAEDTEEAVIDAPPYNLTQQQMDDFEAIMSASEDIPYESLSARVNHTLLLEDNAAADYASEDTRNFLCLPLIRFFIVDIRRVLLPNERVAVVGDHERLGAWQVERAIAMTLNNDDGAQSQSQIWSARVAICVSARLHYRYFIFSVDRYGRRRVHEWEGVPYGRVLEKYQMYRSRGRDQFGLLSHMTIGDVEHERGWLRNEYAIEFKFIWQQHLKFYKYLRLERAEKFLLKMTVAQNGFALPPNAWRDTELEVSWYVYNRSNFQPQPRHGVPYAAGDIVVFRFTVPLNARNSYQLSIFTADGEAIGDAHILALDLRGSNAVLRLPILSAEDGIQIGTLTLPFTMVRPLRGAENYNMRGSFQRYWPMNWPPMDVAHRGIGATFNTNAAPPLVENTIASFLYAYENKAEMVEFDVQLTRDYVPVVWHDFGFKTAPKARAVKTEHDLEYVLIKDATYQQLKNSRIFSITNNGEVYEYTHFNTRATSETERLFPTLRQVLQALPSTLGVDIEIKWPQVLENNAAESTQTLNKNRVVDVILKTTMQYGCGRALLFSSFDADICTMVRLKQNVFPVAFITMGEKASVRTHFKDLRTRSYVNAVNFAQAANLLGTVPHAANFLTNSASLDFGLDLGQATFVWGEELHNAQAIKQFKRWHASGVIYDRIDLYGTQRKRESFFNAPELVDMFTRQCIVIGHTNCSSELELPDGTDLHGKPVSIQGCEVIVGEFA